jgi:peptidoglycan/xylan/chitin deacetylase (PgdA/CDA1 family)
MAGVRALGWRLAGSWLAPVASRMARGRLQILCFHGFSFVDEHLFRGTLFMSATRLEERLRWLRDRRFAVLPLEDALARLRAGALREREIAVTIDDGFHSVHSIARPLLKAYSVPATVYVTSHYVVHPFPVFRLAIQYMAWKSARDHVAADGLIEGVSGPMRLRGAGASSQLESLYRAAESHLDEQGRASLAREFGQRVGVDYDELVRSRRLSLMSTEEIRELSHDGFDIELHTHRHALPIDADAIAREIADNRAVLEPLTGRTLHHLCYPSGVWDTRQWPALESAGIRSATTCLPGLNRGDEAPLALRRFLDAEAIPLAEFAAEMLAVKDLGRRLRRASRLAGDGERGAVA